MKRYEPRLMSTTTEPTPLFGLYTNLSRRNSDLGPTLSRVLSKKTSSPTEASPLRMSSSECTELPGRQITRLTIEDAIHPVSHRGSRANTELGSANRWLQCQCNWCY